MRTPVAILQEMADQYCVKLGAVQPRRIEIQLTDTRTVFFINLVCGSRPVVGEGKAEDPSFVITVDSETLRRLSEGELAPLTAAGRERLSDPAPLDFNLPAGEEMTADRIADMVEFVLRFFNPTRPERILLGEEHTRRIHGGRAVALFYDRGFRSAWYCLHKGEQLNRPGDTNPFPQGFIVLSGEGLATIGDRTTEIKTNEAYYIPSGATHVFRNDADEPLTGVWLAWGQGA